MVRCSGKGVARKGSTQILLNDEIVPRLTGRSCGEFPCKGRTLPSRRFLPIALVIVEPIRWFLHAHRSEEHTSEIQSRSPPLFPSTSLSGSGRAEIFPVKGELCLPAASFRSRW